MNNEQRSSSERGSRPSHGFGRRAADQTPIAFPSQGGAGGPDLGPLPKPKRARASRSQVVVFLNFVMTVIVLAMVGIGIGLWFGKQQFDEPGPLKETALFTVRKGAGINEIARGLERAGVIADERVFSIGARIDGASAKLKAGEYEIKAGASMRDVLELLKSGKSVLYSLTVPEGLTVKQAFDRIAASAELTGELPAQLPPEGSLVADTQKFPRGMDRTELVNKMSAEQQKLVEAIWQTRIEGLPVNDINEFVTLAS
ncbi:MAG: endolytic transglycosylase MltG, partial [Planctomycetales bacterium]|nr:endolytic transglycosylase MltG [Planctomycetales bacterium]